MKILFLLALLFATPQNDTVVQDSAEAQVTIHTSATGVVVQDASYGGTPGQYYIGETTGKVSYVNSAGGFTIADPKLAETIDSRTSKVVFTFLSNIIVDGQHLPVQIRLDVQSRAPKQ